MITPFRIAPRLCRHNSHRYARFRPLQRVTYATSNVISDPSNGPPTSNSVSLAHPKDPGSPAGSTGQSSSGESPLSTPSPPPLGTPSQATENDAQTISSNPPVPFMPLPQEHSDEAPEPPSNLPSPHPHPASPYAYPPFDTYRFFAALEKTFPTPTARSLMRATRALLVDRVGRVRREALTVKDLESVSTCKSSYLTKL